MTMLQHHLLLAYRNFKRYKSSFFINLIGLSTGLACVLLIYWWIDDEYRMDRFHARNGQLYQVMHNLPMENGGFETTEHTPGLLASSLAEQMPEVEYATSVIPPSWFHSKGIVSFKGTHLKAGGQFVGKDYFKIFSWKFIEGSPDSWGNNKQAIAISDELARKLFQTTGNAMGKVIEWKQEPFSGPYLIAGVFQKPSHLSTAQFDALLPFELFFDQYQNNLTNWGNSNPSTYLVLKPGTDVDAFGQKITQFRKAKFVAAYGSKDLKWVGPFFLQRYADRYLYNRYENGKVVGGRIDYIELLALVAVFILIIAGINFTNLATAQASTRLREIGVKKTFGADRKALLVQFLSESMALTFLALVVASLLILILLPQFNNIVGKQLIFRLDGRLIGSALAITVITGLLAGGYPALYLSGFKPIAVLKGKLQTTTTAAWARKGLVVFQFMVSVILIVSVILVYQQISFIQGKNLGYSKDNIIRFANEGEITGHIEPFLSEVKKIPGVIEASSFGHDLVGRHGAMSGLLWEGQQQGGNSVEFSGLEVGYDLLDLLEIQMVQGRRFSHQFGSDSLAIIFNEAAVKAMALKEPVGKRVMLFGKIYHIIGVTKNFHFESMYQQIKPCLIRVIPNNRNILIKIAAGNKKQTLDRIQKLYQAYNPGIPFDFNFLDQDYQQLYAAEMRVAALSRYSAGIAILIACLGLFGLAKFIVGQHRKEIGVRKVLGASVGGVAMLLSSDFLKLVLLAVIVGLPIAWYAMHQWLQGFAYKIQMEWWVFLLAGLVTICIGLLTVCFQSIKAALANPIAALQSE